jgi:hypothetical protein
MKIEERWPCPRCGHRRRVLWGARTHVCFNCGFQADLPDAEPAFTGAAEAAGVYSDRVAA